MLRFSRLMPSFHRYSARLSGERVPFGIAPKGTKRSSAGHGGRRRSWRLPCASRRQRPSRQCVPALALGGCDARHCVRHQNQKRVVACCGLAVDVGSRRWRWVVDGKAHGRREGSRRFRRQHMDVLSVEPGHRPRTFRAPPGRRRLRVALSLVNFLSANREKVTRSPPRRAEALPQRCIGREKRNIKTAECKHATKASETPATASHQARDSTHDQPIAGRAGTARPLESEIHLMRRPS